MKNLILILVSVLMLTACEEQEAADSSSTGGNGGGIGAPVAPVDLPYTGADNGMTGLALLSDQTRWNATISGSPSYSTGSTSATYTSNNFGGMVTTSSKFKFKGDLNDNGSFTASANLNFPANNQMLLEAVRLNFGVSSQPAFIQVSLTALNDNMLVYRLTFADENQASNDIVFDYPIGSNTVNRLVPVVFTRDNTGVVTVTVNGNARTFNQSSLSQDVDLMSMISGQGSGGIQDIYLSTSSFADFGGR